MELYALVAELLGLLDDEAVEDLDDDVELDAEHADRQADGEARVRAQGHAVGCGDDGHRAVVGNRRAAEARDAELHELDGAADDEAGLPVAHDDTGDKAPEDGIVDEDHRDAVVVHVLDEGQQGQKDDLQDRFYRILPDWVVGYKSLRLLHLLHKTAAVKKAPGRFRPVLPILPAGLSLLKPDLLRLWHSLLGSLRIQPEYAPLLQHH